VTSVTVYTPVRRDEAREWFDVSCISRSPEIATSKAQDLDERIPEWAKANPVVRIATCTLTEQSS
jgi:hypothetical protein